MGTRAGDLDPGIILLLLRRGVRLDHDLNRASLKSQEAARILVKSVDYSRRGQSALSVSPSVTGRLAPG